MKKLWIAMMLAAGLSVSVAAMAQSAGAVPAAAMTGGPAGAGGHQGGACHAIKEACKAAGFVKGEAAEGKGIRKDCMEPILAGKSVAGVNVSASEVQACQAKRAERK